MTDNTDHPAVQANIKSIALAAAGDKAGWLNLYADDAIVQDPVGISPFDAAGEGQKGKAAISQFWDNVIGPSNISIEVQSRIVSGDKACAVHQTAINDMGNGKQTRAEMVAIYELNDAGKIQRMSAYWSWADMEAQLKEMGFM